MNVVVALLAMGQFAWACFAEQHAPGISGILPAVLGVGLGLPGFEKLRTPGMNAAAGSPCKPGGDAMEALDTS